MAESVETNNEDEIKNRFEKSKITEDGDKDVLDNTNLRDCFDELITNSASLYLDQEIAILNKPPSSLEFYRDYVSWNRPCLIKHGFDHWPANYLWTNSYLRKKMNDKIVTIAATPNGFADAVYKNKYFVLPQQRLMSFTDFVDHLEFYHDHDSSKCQWNIDNKQECKIEQINDENATEKKYNFDDKEDDDDNDDNYCSLCNEILYCQLQNGCMIDEYDVLCDDIELEIEWVSKALNKKPDAINFWMGENRSISSLHQDPYENIYCVINGEKRFILYPPTDEIYLNKIPFKKSIYNFNKQTKIWSIEYHPKWEYIHWIDLLNNNNLNKCNKLEVIVKKGEMLYLPALWFHQVYQNVDEFGRVIAVNFWYDMNYDIKWNLLNFMKSTIKYNNSMQKK